MPVEWAPLHVPLERRLQTLAVLLILPAQIVAIAAFIALLYWNVYTRTLAVLYFMYVLLDDSPSRGGWRTDRWLYRITDLVVPWDLFAAYFPIRLVKTVELDPTKRYLFSYHPHSILAFGAVVNFITGTRFIDLFPDILVRAATLDATFKIPFFRDWALSQGMISCSKRSIASVFTDAKQTQSIMLVPGGAQEALDCQPGTMDLTLLNRKGFVKIALKHGAHLVPVIGFGETDTYKSPFSQRGTKVREIQDKIQKKLSFAVPLIYGRGVWNYSFGLLPYRAPITSVVGSPIELPKIEEPTKEDIDKYHTIYMETLRKLYDEHKDTYAKDRKREMRFF